MEVLGVNTVGIEPRVPHPIALSEIKNAIPLRWEGVVAVVERGLPVTRTLTDWLVYVLTLGYSFMV